MEITSERHGEQTLMEIAQQLRGLLDEPLGDCVRTRLLVSIANIDQLLVRPWLIPTKSFISQLGVPRSTYYYLLAQGRIAAPPSILIGRSKMVIAAEVPSWLKRWALVLNQTGRARR